MTEVIDDLDRWAENAKKEIRSACVGALNEIGGRSVDRLIESLNDPYPPASSPGDAPHRRTGQLSAGITFATSEFWDGVTTLITCNRADGDERIPNYLEEGTTNMAARPFMLPELERLEGEFLSTARELLGAEMQAYNT